MQTVVRPAIPSDAPAAGGLMAQLAEHTQGHIDPGVQDRFRAMIELPQYAIFVAEDEAGQVIGLLSASQRWTLWHTGPCAFIEELVVDERARRQGSCSGRPPLPARGRPHRDFPQPLPQTRRAGRARRRGHAGCQQDQ